MAISEKDAVAVPIMSEAVCAELLHDADFHSFTPTSAVMAYGLVRQQLKVVESFPSGSVWHRLRDEFQTEFTRQLVRLSDYPFNTTVVFNTMVLQRYPAGSLGITPHRDGPSRINLVCVFVLEGEAEFGLCDDRTGSNARVIAAPPGHVIFMRAPGFFHTNAQPFHFLRAVHTQRTTFGLRQRLFIPQQLPLAF